MTPWLVRLFPRRLLRHPPPPLRVVLLLVGVITYGASGFLFFELPENPTLTWADGFWYAFVTVSTVGYGDLSPATFGGRFFVALPMMFFGIGLLGYVLSLAASALVEQKSKESHGMSQFDFVDHLVICNLPNLSVVLQLLDELRADSSFGLARQVVLVDSELVEIPQELVKREVRFVRGDPSGDEALGRANVARARAVIVLSKPANEPLADMSAVAVALAVKALAPETELVAQCVEPAHLSLLRKAGCARVVCTGQFGAHFLASELLNPGAQDIVADLTSSQGGEQLYVAPYGGPASDAASLRALCSRQGHLLIGIRRGGAVQLNPPDDSPVAPSDQVVTIGAKRLVLG